MLKDLRFADYFLFTQHSLETFEKCPLKFKKRYLEGLRWESILDESIKERLEIGNSFHLLAYRYFLGIEPGLEPGVKAYDKLSKWLNTLQTHFKKEDNALYLPEYKLRTAKGNLRLEANFDLLIVREGSIEIWDWKTQGESTGDAGINERLRERRLRESLQSKVYLFVLREQLKRVIQKGNENPQIKMCYWQPEPAKTITEIEYSQELHENFTELLESRINTILEYDYNRFDKEMYKKSCRSCEFNWFCNNTKVDYKSVEGDIDFLDGLCWDDIDEII